MKTRYLFGLAVLGLLAYGAAHAAPNLAVVSRDAASFNACNGKPVRSAPCPSIYATPKAGDLVRVSPTNTADWASDTFTWQEWSTVPPGTRYETGAQDVPEGTPTTSPLVTAWPWVAKLAPPVNTTGTATLTWTAVTTNTDGSALTGLTGYRVWQGASVATLAQIATVGPAVLTYDVAGLPTGTYYFAVTAYTAIAESAKSASPSVDVVRVVVPKTPSAPGSVTVTIKVTVP